MQFKRKAGWLVKFRIFETDQFLEDLTDDFNKSTEQIRKKLSAYVYPQLRNNPFFGKNIKKLVAYQPETWRYRIGNYRFFYEIDQDKKIVFMIAADNRKNVY